MLNFFLFRILPGDPARSVKDPRLTQEAIAAMQARFGLDKPLSTQFFLYVRNLLAGDLGISFHQQRPVAQILGGYLWNTVLLVGTGTVLAIFIGMFFDTADGRIARLTKTQSELGLHPDGNLPGDVIAPKR